MNLTSIAIKNKILTLSILVIILFAGISVFNGMPRDDMPPFLIRFVNVVSVFPGASPERVEMLVSDKIEKVIQEISQVDYITSESRTGISVITIAIKESETDLQPIFDRVRRKVEGVRSELPDGVVPKVDDEIGDVFAILIGLTGDGYTNSELKDIADDVRDGLIKLPGSAKVEISGAHKERIFIDYESSRIAEIGLTKQKLQGILSSTNIIFPGGDVQIGNERIILEPTGNLQSIADLKSLIISTDSNGNVIYLGDITKVYRGYEDPPDGIVKINGVPGIVVGVSLKEGGNVISLGKEINEKLDEYREIYPIGVEFQRVASQDIVVEKSVNDFISNLLQSVVVVLLTMLAFLGLRTGLVVASLIPSTIVMTLLIMSGVGIGLNKVSLASLIIALGMLVDNAIVMSESILVKMENGEKVVDAAIGSCKELTVPLLVSTLTTSAAFLSFYLAESVMGEIMGQIFVVVSIALLSSWLLSLTLIPLLSTIFLKIKKETSEEAKKLNFFDKIRKWYRGLLIMNLKKPYLLIFVLLGTLCLSVWSARFLTVSFFPDSERALVSANLELPLGTSIEKTRLIVDKVEKHIADNLKAGKGKPEGVVSWSSYIGEGAPKYDLGYTPPEASSNAAHILINTTSDAANDEIINSIYDFCFSNFPDITAQVSRLASGGNSGDPVAIRITGKEPDALYDIIGKVKSMLNQTPGTKSISDSWGPRTKKFVVNINQAKAQNAGITSQDIATSLQTVLSGASTGTYREGDKSIPIIMRVDAKETSYIAQLESIDVYSQSTGAHVPLKQLADIEIVWQPAKILRRDLYKTITVSCDVQSGYTAKDITTHVIPWLEREKENWGSGYSYELGGEAENSAKSMGAVIKYLDLSFFIIILLLIGQFNSLKKPAIVLLTIPLGIIGVIFGLLFTGSYFGFMSFLGIISLAGIVINNGIVLLDRIQIEMDENKRTPAEAIVEAAVQRFRPILLTTATTSLGLIPLWISGGLMWEPMAIGIIFGLLFATVLTLLFVPTLYRIFFRVSYADFD